MNIFYSWQSDLPSKTNANVIRTALQNACSGNNNWNMDEATRNTSGSPDISFVVEGKIRECDVFVADVSLINGDCSVGKKTSNPNVLYELGIASGIIGWNRIILVFNQAYGNMDDLPFDIRKHRCLRYDVSEQSSLSNAQKVKSLGDDLSRAIKQIEQDNPLKRIYEGKNPEEIKHNRDVNSLLDLLNHIDLEALSARAMDGPHQLRHSAIDYSDILDVFIQNASFSLYDKDTELLIKNIHENLNKTISVHYKDTGNPQWCVWSLPNDIFPTKEEENEYEFVKEACYSLQKSISLFVDKIHSAYLEIDLNKTNVMARKNRST